jgi:murein L,D-transpeptidase YcbB/YkuD
MSYLIRANDPKGLFYTMLKRISMLRYILLASIVGCAGCRPSQTSSHGAVFNEPIIALVDSIKIPTNPDHEIFKGIKQPAAVQAVYQIQKQFPLWLSDDLPGPKTNELINAIRNVRRFGLLPDYYHAQEITQLALDARNRSAMGRLDVLCTDAFLSLTTDVRWGRTRNPVMDSAAVARVVKALHDQNLAVVLKSEEPKTKGYRDLKMALNNIMDTLPKSDYELLMSGFTLDSVMTHQLVKRIEINLERWRNEELDSLRLYAFINIPSYKFYVIENGMEIMESKVIVGKPDTPTPTLTSTIDCFTIFPYWFVPRKISVNEYLPQLKRDSTFLKRNNFDVLERNGNVKLIPFGDWEKYAPNNFPFTLRQREGTDNSLGIIKFTFDNPYAVYLHDTNAKYLFKHSKRAFSHGCIRLENAVQFSQFLIGDGRSNISPQQLNKYFLNAKRVTINLAMGVPIYVRYYTCEMRNGKLIFYPDLYGKDKKLMVLLYPKMMM